jgi:hypothetical protein
LHRLSDVFGVSRGFSSVLQTFLFWSLDKAFSLQIEKAAQEILDFSTMKSLRDHVISRKHK